MNFQLKLVMWQFWFKNLFRHVERTKIEQAQKSFVQIKAGVTIPYYGFESIAQVDGSGVLVSDNIVVTAAHVIKGRYGKGFKTLTIYHPETKKEIAVKAVHEYKGLERDFAVIELEESLEGCSARIDFNSSAQDLRGKTVFSVLGIKDMRGKVINSRVVRGAAIYFAKRFRVKDALPALRSMFSLKARPGDSGAGIFSADGDLLTILTQGDKTLSLSAGVSIEKFRKLVSRHCNP